MNPTIQLQLLLATFAGWVNHQQAQLMDYLMEENRVRKESLKAGGKLRQSAARSQEVGERSGRASASVVF